MLTLAHDIVEENPVFNSEASRVHERESALAQIQCLSWISFKETKIKTIEQEGLYKGIFHTNTKNQQI